VEAYTNKCFSAFYGSVDDKKPLKTFDVFQRVAHLYPQASYLWLKQLRNISKENILTIFSYIPNSRISSITSEFAQKILEFNQNKILKLEDLLS
jgi:hypothetical protein